MPMRPLNVFGTRPEALKPDSVTYRQMAHAVNPFGHGKAADHIVPILEKMR